MEAHRERVRKNDPETAGTNVTTAVIRGYERDVRALLDYLDGDYIGPTISETVKRIRRMVGYSE